MTNTIPTITPTPTAVPSANPQARTPMIIGTSNDPVMAPPPVFPSKN